MNQGRCAAPCRCRQMARYDASWRCLTAVGALWRTMILGEDAYLLEIANDSKFSTTQALHRRSVGGVSQLKTAAFNDLSGGYSGLWSSVPTGTRHLTLASPKLNAVFACLTPSERSRSVQRKQIENPSAFTALEVQPARTELPTPVTGKSEGTRFHRARSSGLMKSAGIPGGYRFDGRTMAPLVREARSIR